MSEDELAVVCDSVLELRRVRRSVFADLDRFEAVLALALHERGRKSYAYRDVRFRVVPRAIHGTPSERRKWRAACPPHALDAWSQPLRIVVDYPHHETRIGI